MTVTKLRVMGHRVLIKPEKEDKETDWGFDMEAGREKTWAAEQGATQIGTIVDIGPNAWLDYKPGTPWAEVGMRVYYAKYAGKDVKVGDEELVVVNDEDLSCEILEVEEDAA